MPNFEKLIDIDLLSYFKSKLDLLFANKVDKETGKGLSTNDYTASEKTKLSGIATGAQVNVLEGIQVNGATVSPTNKIANIPVATTSAAGAMSASDKEKLDGIDTSADVNVIESIKVNGTAQAVTNKAVDISVPTATSDLTNDSGFITSEDVPEGAAASTTTPAMDGTAAVGTETTFARGDHVHPTDTSRAPTSHASTATTYGAGTSANYGHVKLSDATNGTAAAASGGTAATPKAVADALTAAKSYADGVTENDFTDTYKSKLDGIAEGAQVNAVTSVNSKTGEVVLDYSDVGAAAASHGTHVSYSSTSPVMDGTAAVGTASTVARSDHVHPTDTSRASASDLSALQTTVAGKQDTLTWDSTPTSGSSNPVTSGGVYSAIAALGSVFSYKGVVAAVANLPASGNTTGDVYHVTATGGEYVWNGSAWEELGSVIDLSGYAQTSDFSLATNSDIDGLFTE